MSKKSKQLETETKDMSIAPVNLPLTTEQVLAENALLFAKQGTLQPQSQHSLLGWAGRAAECLKDIMANQAEVPRVYRERCAALLSVVLPPEPNNGQAEVD